MIYLYPVWKVLVYSSERDHRQGPEASGLRRDPLE